jgi:hypothetical protein
MKWINPNRQKLKISRCEFCNSDISTPYKGVHNETEFINGFPAPCRNNGRLNIHIELGYPKGEEPNPRFKYFVEHPDTHLWWSGYTWTNNPHEAFACELERTADRYARFQGLQNYIITQHEFVSGRE